ncbi:hypothetical protein GCM10023183_32570 [Nibribacter koreensis]|uniref:Uncharacterized protein n=2 Tax=Nibribacter koreensis TaxID=1084519 RepID=A0ABP8FXW5_9BACT
MLGCNRQKVSEETQIQDSKKSEKKLVFTQETTDRIKKAVNTDSVQLTAFTRSFYKWYEQKGRKPDFIPVRKSTKDSAYMGIDWKAHNIRVTELKNTGFFSNAFLDNYQRIAERIDQKLKSGEEVWLVGEMSPFGPDANAWCNCQDTKEKYWETLTIQDFQRGSGKATFQWTWGDAFTYAIKTEHVQNKWFISEMEGFQFENYFGIDQARPE